MHAHVHIRINHQPSTIAHQPSTIPSPITDHRSPITLTLTLTRIQAKRRGLLAQKQVFELATAAESVIDKLRNPAGTDAVAAVTKAYRAKHAFSLLLLKAFKQQQVTAAEHLL